MSKLLILTAAVLSAGAAAISKAIAENPDGAAADIILINAEAQKAAELKKQMDGVLEVNAQLAEEIEKAQAKASEVPDNFTTHSFKAGDQKYGFNFPQMSHKGKLITSQDVVDSEELQQELIAIRSGMIYPKA